jgi:hypothetical protein
MDTKFRKLGLGLILLVAIMRTSYADPETRILPAGTKIQLPRGGEEIIIGFELFLIPRSEIDRANATARVVQKLENELVKCSSELAERRRPEETWKTATKWTTIGLAVGAAFVAGGWLL